MPGRLRHFIWVLFLIPCISKAGPVVQPSIDRALDRLYNFDFEAAHAILDEHQLQQPDEPIGAGIRAATYLFEELDRMKILEAEFFEEDKRIAAKEGMEPDPEIREKLMASLEKTQELAGRRLVENPDDPDALFALTMKEGILNDYRGLVERKRLGAVTGRSEGNRYAKRLLELDPTYYDAHLATGVNEYVLGSLPFFVRWFVSIDGVKGSKDQAVSELELVAKHGHYLGPFAKILLSIIWLRENEPERSAVLLGELSSEYPDNPLMQKEYLKVKERLGDAGVATNGAH